MPAVTGHGAPRHFFHFWRHPSWPNLASSILNLCRRKTSFQWCPDQGDWLNGGRDMNKNAQKVEWKTRSKISCHYTWLLHRKICPSRLRFLKSILTKSKPSTRSVTAGERKEKARKERRKKKSKIEKLKDVGHFLLKILISAYARARMSKNAMLVARTASCRVADAFSTRLKPIWPKSSLKNAKMSRKRAFCEKLRGAMG